MRQYYKKFLLLSVVVAFNQPVHTASLSVEARSLGMGNVQVATADIATAPFANPGMLALMTTHEDFSLLLGVGGFFSDTDGAVDKIDNFQAAYDSFEADPVGNVGEGQRAVDIAQSLDRDIIAPQASALFASGFSGETWAFALSARRDALVAGTVTNISQDLTELVDPAKNILELEGMLVTELGFSVARNFQLFGQKIAVGIKPRYVMVDNIYFSESITTIDSSFGDLLGDGNKTDLDDYTTLDIGIVTVLTEHTRIGLVATNLVSHQYHLINSAGNPATLSFDTQARFGIAYLNDFLTLGADIDLLENDALLTSVNFDAFKSQFISIGGEFNVYDFMQLRIGVQKNIADGISDSAKDNLYTAGVGFCAETDACVGLWFGFNLNLALVVQNESRGGFLQAGFRF
jgi:hypothetical protein